MGALTNLQALLAKGIDNALLRYGIGNEYLKLADYPQAALHFRKAIEFDANYSAAWKALGQCLAAARDDTAAMAAYTQGIAVAEARGDIQAAKEMRVFLKRLQKEDRPPQ